MTIRVVDTRQEITVRLVDGKQVFEVYRVTLTIDVEGLRKTLFDKAPRNKTSTARSCNGHVRLRAERLNVVQGNSPTKEKP